eukprot:m.327335 g.327335  ORF g.327335 m.327335 type:complete len:291 (+) comp20412_c1_seq33:1362-2234(+)
MLRHWGQNTYHWITYSALSVVEPVCALYSDGLSYALPTNPCPYLGWPTTTMFEATKENLLPQAFRTYFRKMLGRFVTVLSQHPGRVSVHVMCGNALKLNSVLRQLKFDRIGTSNLIDHLGARPMLSAYASVINRSNKYACVTMDCMNWSFEMPAIIKQSLLKLPTTSKTAASVAGFEEWLSHNVGVDACESEGFHLRRYNRNKVCLQWGETKSMTRDSMFPESFLEWIPKEHRPRDAKKWPKWTESTFQKRQSELARSGMHDGMHCGMHVGIRNCRCACACRHTSLSVCI